MSGTHFFKIQISDLPRTLQRHSPPPPPHQTTLLLPTCYGYTICDTDKYQQVRFGRCSFNPMNPKRFVTLPENYFHSQLPAEGWNVSRASSSTEPTGRGTSLACDGTDWPQVEGEQHTGYCEKCEYRILQVSWFSYRAITKSYRKIRRVPLRARVRSPFSGPRLSGKRRGNVWVDSPKTRVL